MYPGLLLQGVFQEVRGPTVYWTIVVGCVLGGPWTNCILDYCYRMCVRRSVDQLYTGLLLQGVC